MKNLCVSTLLVLFVLSSCVFYDEKTKSDSSRGLELEQVPINKIDMTCEEFYDLEKKLSILSNKGKKYMKL